MVDLDLFFSKVEYGHIGFHQEKKETLDFSERFEACDLKLGRYRQLVELMKLCECKRSLTLAKDHSHIQIYNLIFSETAWLSQIYVKHPYDCITEVALNGPGHMTMMLTRATNSISKNLSESFFSETIGRNPTKLGM